MNDDQLITAVREPFTTVHMNTPVEQIVSRGRAVRARRRIPGMAGAVAAAAGVALAVTALLPGSRPPTAHLTAWTVTGQPGGAIHVTVSELRDPAGLQSTLRADGVPASVSFFGQQNPACQPYPYGPYGPGKRQNQADRRRGLHQIANSPQGHLNVIVIHPSALPAGAGLRIGASITKHQISVGVGLVQASQQCTGS